MCRSDAAGLSRRALLRALGAGVAAGALPGCVTTNPATGRSSFTGLYDVDDDIAIGTREHPKLLEAFGGEYADRRLQAYVEGIGRSLAAHTEFQQFPYRFTLLNSPVVNAFALPGGYVYLTRGLLALASNEAEIASVLAHELGHVNARHTAERMSAVQLAQFGVLAGAIGAAALGLPSGVADLGANIASLSIQSYSRSQEFEGDTLGLRYMSLAGYEPDAMASFLATLREHSQIEAQTLGLPAGKVDEHNIMATHPRTVDRVREAQAAANAARPARSKVGREAYLAAIDGMLFGDDPSQGIVTGTRFVHPELRFALRMPAGFRIQNSPRRVLARDPRGAAVIFDMGRIEGSGDPLEYLTREWAARANLRDVERIEVNGLAGATGRTVGSNRSGPVDLRLVTIKAARRRAYRLVFVSPRERTRSLQAAFRGTTYSVRRLSRVQAARIKPLRIEIQSVGGGATVAKLARKLPYGRFNEDWFRVLNDLPAGAEPRPGQVLKLIRT